MTHYLINHQPSDGRSSDRLAIGADYLKWQSIQYIRAHATDLAADIAADLVADLVFVLFFCQDFTSQKVLSKFLV